MSLKYEPALQGVPLDGKPLALALVGIPGQQPQQQQQGGNMGNPKP